MNVCSRDFAGEERRKEGMRCWSQKEKAPAARTGWGSVVGGW